MNRSRQPPRARGTGAAAARQMGLLLDLPPDGGVELGGNEADLETELLAIVGESGPAKKERGRAPVPMADIERMAALCMKDLDEDEEEEEDGDLEGDEDLMAELNEVLQEESEPETTPPPRQGPTPCPAPGTPISSGGLESLLTERIDMYQAAIINTRAAGESSKTRRYERGLKTLQSMLSSVKKGKPISEEEIPPPVATGSTPALPQAPPPEKPGPIREQVGRPEDTPALSANERALQEAPPIRPKPSLLVPPQGCPATTPETPLISPLTPSQPDSLPPTGVRALVLSRQREYKLAALKAKQSGRTELARSLYHSSKLLDPVLEALNRGESVDLGTVPPPPDPVTDSPAPPVQSTPQPPATALPPTAEPAPRSVAEALQQRMEKYRVAAETAKSKGDDRKARMHQRIIKQYQDAIRANKAGRPVNLSELPVPPGCPPLQGSEARDGQQSIMGVLETAMKLANQDADAEEEGGPEEEDVKSVLRPAAPRPPAHRNTGVTPAPTDNPKPKMGPKAQQQTELLQTRKQQLLKAALRAKQLGDMQGAALHLRHAKGLEPMIAAASAGLPIDISKMPSAPVSDSEYTLVQSSGPSLSPAKVQQYRQLMDLLKQQHQKCLSHSQQFTSLGNVAETARFERLSDHCLQSLAVLRRAHGGGQPVPAYHYEERTISTVKVFPKLSSSEMQLTIVKGINLPAPSGSPNDLDASIRFEFPFPSLEEAQRDKTSTVKNTNCPEFGDHFQLSISRGHRALKRVIHSKGIRLEVVHKGGLFKGDKVVGTGQLKLEALDTQCEIRQFVEVLDGRRPTGGRVEVRVRIREPLEGPQLDTVTERWLVIDPPAAKPPPAAAPKSQRSSDPPKDNNANRSAPYKLHSLSLLNYDKERAERKLSECRQSRRDPPADLLQQHKDVCRRLQWQRGVLERPSPGLLKDYEAVLKKFIVGLGDSVKQLSSQGHREAARDALYRMKMVESEMESLQKRRPRAI
ncbi:coiled-coil and C2 domain-containing protein 1A [Amia ocellicauda]|uniref:coiled-coil and C2 domain-containing protein 1A n=1 Tax=Amia ocellicauda TaxID=2972642 RepID=UPI003464931F